MERCLTKLFKAVGILSVLLLFGTISLVLGNNIQYSNALPISSNVHLNTFQNSILGISIQYPSNWNKVEDDRGAWFKTSNESAYVRLESIDNKKQMPAQFSIERINLTKQQFPARELLGENDTTIGSNLTGHQILFKYTEEPSDKKGLQYEQLQVWTIVKVRAYVISYFTRADTFGDYLPVVQRMIESFKLIPTRT